MCQCLLAVLSPPIQPHQISGAKQTRAQRRRELLGDGMWPKSERPPPPPLPPDKINDKCLSSRMKRQHEATVLRVQCTQSGSECAAAPSLQHLHSEDDGKRERNGGTRSFSGPQMMNDLMGYVMNCGCGGRDKSTKQSSATVLVNALQRWLFLVSLLSAHVIQKLHLRHGKLEKNKQVVSCLK